MSEDIFINITPQETRVAIVQQGIVQELHIERTISRGLVGNIYLGKVLRILPGMQSAFIDIGLERAAFLHVADIWQAPDSRVPPAAIERTLFDGKVIMVQVIKDPLGTKGARLTTHMSVAGRSLVLLPHDTHIGISQKIIGEENRECLRQRLQSLLPKGVEVGLIARTLAEDASDVELLNDIIYLRKTWDTLQHLSRTLPAPNLLHQDLSLAQRVLRDLASEKTQSIYIDSRENFLKLQTFGHTYMPVVTNKLTHYIGEHPIFDLHNIETEIERILHRRVDLKSGGYLIIDQTEALTTVDVNTGGFVGTRNFDDTIFKTNLEAAHMIARQLRLRNLGGIIIVDFIDMKNDEHRDTVLTELRRALANDRNRCTTSDFSPLGLVEITRKRTRESLSHILCEPCPACNKRGEVKTTRTLCYSIMREITREARQFNPKEFRILATPAVIDALLDEENQHLTMLGDFIGKPISLQAEQQFSPEQYDIILM
ncbi:MAG: ribonuclease G [Ottowia sp.]|nr:ribonuclease G [Ottowia sp.]